MKQFMVYENNFSSIQPRTKYNFYYYLSLDVRKPVIGVSDQAKQNKRACSVSETPQRLGFSTIVNILFRQWTIETPLRETPTTQRRCALVVHICQNRLSREVVNMIVLSLCPCTIEYIELIQEETQSIRQA